MTTHPATAVPIGVRAGRTWWGAVAVGCVLVVGYAAVMIGSGFRALPAEIQANGFPLALHVHIVGAAVALLAAPWQFSRRIRRDHPALHHWTGRLYATGAVVGGLGGLLAAPFSSSGAVAASAFLTLAVLWLATTVAAVLAARRHDFATHRRWAIWSGSLIFAAVTLRIYLGIGLAATGGDFPHVYPVVAWLSWLPNLLVAEWLVRRTDVVPVRLPWPTQPASAKVRR